MRLEGKVALITGAGRGTGYAIALAFAKEGSDIIVADVNFETAIRVAEEIKVLGRQAQAIKVDVSIPDEVDQMVNQAISRFLRIDILVNCAAPTERANVPIEETSEDMWDRQLDIGLKGTFLCSRAVGREMIKQRYGKIINIASIAARYGRPGRVAYCASKAGILGLTRACAVEWGRYNINVNAISPSVIKTSQWEFVEKAQPGRFAAVMKRYPLKRFNEPRDIANAALFLASSEADNISGQEICVDSGVGVLMPSHVWPEEY